jgi:hypothetical protein
MVSTPQMATSWYEITPSHATGSCAGLPSPVDLHGFVRSHSSATNLSKPKRSGT